MIAWTAFDWPSFATLTTGLAAVSAAYAIGRRKVKLAEKQHELSLSQVENARSEVEYDRKLREQAHRLALLERRADIIDELRLVWTRWSQDEAIDPETWQRLQSVLQRAQLLYPQDIAVDLEEALLAAMKERL